MPPQHHDNSGLPIVNADSESNAPGLGLAGHEIRCGHQICDLRYQFCFGPALSSQGVVPSSDAVPYCAHCPAYARLAQRNGLLQSVYRANCQTYQRSQMAKQRNQLNNGLANMSPTFENNLPPNSHNPKPQSNHFIGQNNPVYHGNPPTNQHYNNGGFQQAHMLPQSHPAYHPYPINSNPPAQGSILARWTETEKSQIILLARLNICLTGLLLAVLIFLIGSKIKRLRRSKRSSGGNSQSVSNFRMPRPRWEWSQNGEENPKETFVNPSSNDPEYGDYIKKPKKESGPKSFWKRNDDVGSKDYSTKQKTNNKSAKLKDNDREQENDTWYLPPNWQTSAMTGRMAPPSSNITSRTGYNNLKLPNNIVSRSSRKAIHPNQPQSPPPTEVSLPLKNQSSNQCYHQKPTVRLISPPPLPRPPRQMMVSSVGDINQLASMCSDGDIALDTGSSDNYMAHKDMDTTLPTDSSPRECSRDDFSGVSLSSPGDSDIRLLEELRRSTPLHAGGTTGMNQKTVSSSLSSCLPPSLSSTSGSMCVNQGSDNPTKEVCRFNFNESSEK